MCTVSNIGNEFGQTFPQRWPQWVPAEPVEPFDPAKMAKFLQVPNPISREEFDALKAELQSLKKLLQAAKLYDKETGQADCEHEEKIALFKRLAELTGVDLTDVFQK